MATKKMIRFYTIILFYVLLGCSCTNKHDRYTDKDMINLAETYRELFNQWGGACAQLRSDYYIFSFNDSSLYLVSCDCEVVRTINKPGEILSANLKNETCLSDTIQFLITTVEDIYRHEIKFVNVKNNIVRMERFDGYYLTNDKPYSSSAFKKLQDSWYIRSKSGK